MLYLIPNRRKPYSITPSPLKSLIQKASNLLDEELYLEVRDGGFKLGGVLLDVATVYAVPVVLVTVDGYTVAVLFWETDLYEVDVVEEDTEDGGGNTGLDFDVEEDTVNSDFDEDTDVTFEDGGTCVNRLGELTNEICEFMN